MLRDYQEHAVSAAVNFYHYRAGHGYVTAPGGSGKSHMITATAERIFMKNGERVVILARSEKLIRQNYAKFPPEFREHVGIYCAGIGENTLDKPITIGTIQSLAKAGKYFQKPFAIALVDECDEITPDSTDDSQYWRFFNDVGNPRIIGFTATPFRTKSGKISWGKEIASIPLEPLISAGHLVPPSNKVGTTLDLSHVPVKLGEYAPGELEDIFLDPALLQTSIQKIKQYSAERSQVLIFTQSLKHSDILATEMERNGMPCVSVHGETDKDELNDVIFPAFERGEIKYLLNCQLLTVGVDLPCIDMIAILRATKSKRLFEQMVYRGTRPYAGKKDFLLLDMGNNLMEHGPLGSPYEGPSKRGEQRPNKGKICPSCEQFTKPLARECPDCGYQFPEPEAARINHSARPDSTSATYYAGGEVQPLVTYEVRGVSYHKHVKKTTGNVTIKIQYDCDHGKYQNVCEWIRPYDDRMLSTFKARGVDLCPPLSGYSVEDLLFHCERMKKPTRITVDHNGEFPRIKQYHWDAPVEEQKSLAEVLDWDEIPF